MLSAFFDESGIHAPDGRLIKLTIGGCLSDKASWDRLSEDWAKAIDAWGLDLFHMADFEARKPPMILGQPRNAKKGSIPFSI